MKVKVVKHEKRERWMEGMLIMRDDFKRKESRVMCIGRAAVGKGGGGTMGSCGIPWPGLRVPWT